MSKEYTKQEVKQELLDNIKSIVKYWANQQHQTERGKCEGVAGN